MDQFDPDEPFGLTDHRRETIGMAVRYVAAGALSLATNVLIVMFLVEWGNISARVATAISFTIIFFANFFIARFWVFAGHGQNWTEQVTRFFVVNISMRAAEYALFLLLFSVFAFHYTICILTSLIISNIVKFSSYRHFVFGASGHLGKSP